MPFDKLRANGLRVILEKSQSRYLPLSFYLYDHFDLYRDAERKLLHAYGRARMRATLAVQRNQQIGSAVDHFWLIGKIFSAVDEPENLDDATHLVEVADHAFN